jgi:hypothetical protein
MRTVGGINVLGQHLRGPAVGKGSGMGVVMGRWKNMTSPFYSIHDQRLESLRPAKGQSKNANQATVALMEGISRRI